MLEYFKIILSKVSFDKKLFERELRKAIKSLVEDELNELKKWCYAQFGKVYGPIIDRQFVLTQ
ncbi:hypothetical protein [Roseivirga sp. E12]|uniref:hypothetical protein n=1 Tax=Roseivirga sp. E12 TaxID=2819237 RepID=UPI001ABCF655|nr:hypothetical protein [Roseivirga sp. E12]MBO3699336.1 hypothetical protein [Roseivirga sp. E12]